MAAGNAPLRLAQVVVQRSGKLPGKVWQQERCVRKVRCCFFCRLKEANWETILPFERPESRAIPRPMVRSPFVEAIWTLMVPMGVGDRAPEHAFVLVRPCLCRRLCQQAFNRTGKRGHNEMLVCFSVFAGGPPEKVLSISHQQLLQSSGGQGIDVNDVLVFGLPPEGRGMSNQPFSRRGA